MHSANRCAESIHPLGQLNTLQHALATDLDYHSADTRHSTHGWHPMPAEFRSQSRSRIGSVVASASYANNITDYASLRQHAATR